MLQIKGLQKSFGNHQVLKQLELSIGDGEFYSLLGPNGAGKSTTINIIAQLIQPDAGQVFIHGLNTNDQSSKIKKLLGVVPQEIALYDDLTAWENLHFWGGLNGVSRAVIQEKGKTILNSFGLFDRKDEKIRAYSGGMKRRINIAAALLHDPQFILMDEPTVGIDPQSRNNIYEFMEDLKKQGKTILYTTHYMEEAERFSHKIGIIDNGQIIAHGTFEEIKKQVNQPASIVIEYEGDVSSILPKLMSLKPNSKLTHENNQLIFDTDNFKNDLKNLVLLFNEGDADIIHIEKKDVNLETIFLKLTGKKLRD